MTLPSTPGLFARVGNRLRQVTPPDQVEESILLRVLVQALVALGILATDLAAGTQMSWWAIPLSVLGALWSWRQRHKRNITIKFILAFAMLMALGNFFTHLVGALNDTRLVLAQLLIQLQVLHSFDLPRRKDLGYSMVIGLVLLGVAGTLSQTLSFGIVLLLFLTLALPALVLDYRSHLGLGPRSWRTHLQQSDLTPRNLGGILALVLALGLVVFAFLPRLPGYQLRSFPVSSAINFQGKFDANSVSNPGYVRGGQAAAGQGTLVQGGTQSGDSDSPGQMDGNYYYGFNTHMNQNLRGSMQPQLVLRVRSQAAGFWRVLAFDHYSGQGWDVSQNHQAEILYRPPWSYEFLIPLLGSHSSTREIIQTYTVVSEFPNLIPTLERPQSLYFPTPQIAINATGSLISPVDLTTGLTYTVISQVPYRDQTQLNQAARVYPLAITERYLQLPPAVAARVKPLAQQLLATANHPPHQPYEISLFLAQALKQRYQIIPDLPFLAPHEDLTEAFLFKFKGGMPDHFATALTVMLRSLGIPARLAVGFDPGTFDPFTGYYEVKNTDAHAITEVYFPDYGWFSFDPIPGHDLFPPSGEEDETFSVLEQFWHWVAGWLPSPVTSLFTWLISGLVTLLGWLFRGWGRVIEALLLVVGGSFLGWLAYQAWMSWRRRRRLARLPAMEQLYQEMLLWLAHQGLPKHSTQTPLEFAAHLPDKYFKGVIEAISRAYVNWRYGRQEVNLKNLRQQLKDLRRSRGR